MRKLMAACACLFITLGAFTQEKTAPVKPATLGIHFGMLDFSSAQAVRSSSLIGAMESDKAFKSKNMYPMLGVSFSKGITPNIDYSVSGFFGNAAYPYRDKNIVAKRNALLSEFDAMLNFKLLSDNYFLSPYLSAGIGGSIYDEWRMDAFLPVGAGLQFSVGSEHFVFANAQYRVPVTQRANYHFMFSLGIASTLGKKN